MASTALRSLSRAAQAPSLPTRSTAPLLLAASFSTTASRPAGKQSDDTGRGRHIIKGKPKKTYKKASQLVRHQVRKPEVGARKAFRKRIELSNNNAVPVNGLDALAEGSLADPHMAGRMVSLPDTVIDQLRAIQAFQPTQSWGMFRRPHFLIRKESVELGKALEEAKEKNEALRMVVTGNKIAGKSMTLLQAMAHGFVNNWVVIHIPEAYQLTNANTDYAPVPNTDPIRFTQPSYTQALLVRIARANSALLKSLPCARDYSKVQFLTHLPEKPNLLDLATSVREAEFAWPVFLALWAELTRVEGRPPVLLTLDGLPHVMKNSEYRDPQFRIVHAFELTLVRIFADAMSGQAPLVNGGAVLAASGGNDNLNIPSLDLVLSQIEAGQAGLEVPKPDPFERGYDERVYDVLKDTRVLRIGGLEKWEARSLMEYWARSGMFLHQVTERVVSEKWALGGNGIVGEMEKAALMRVRY